MRLRITCTLMQTVHPGIENRAEVDFMQNAFVSLRVTKYLKATLYYLRKNVNAKKKHDYIISKIPMAMCM